MTEADEDHGSDQETLCRWLEYQVKRHQEALASLTRLALVDVSGWQADDAASAEAEFARVARQLPERPDNAEQSEGGDRVEEAARLIPHRLFRGPLWVEGHVGREDEAVREGWWELSQRNISSA